MSADKNKKANSSEGFEDFFNRRTAEIEKRGLNSYIGEVKQIGYDERNPRIVYFESNLTGWSSNWNEKSYELAKMAFLYNKRMWIISDGTPVAGNIKQIYLLP